MPPRRPLPLALTAGLPLALLCAFPAQADILRVGPAETITRIADAARLARDGDTVLIMPGEYRGDVAVWRQKRLTLRGMGERPVLVADGHSAEGKAIWVIRDGEFEIENLEFRGARVGDGNGAGIRFEGGRLEVRGCVFEDNQNGILTGNHAEAELVIRDSRFASAPRQRQSLPHLLYVGRIAHLELTGNRFHNGYEGHLVKSRARINEIRYNLLYDGPAGGASYELEFPDGGVAHIVGNIIGQGPGTQNPVVVAYGAENAPWPENALHLAHNTLLSERNAGAWFLRVWDDRFPQGVDVRAVNNLTVGLGLFTLAAPGRFDGNYPAFHGMLSAPEALDFSLAADSVLHGRGTDPLAKGGAHLVPTAEFALPLGTRPLAPPAQWSPGAYQSSPYAPAEATQRLSDRSPAH